MKNDLACFSRKPAGTAAIPSTRVLSALKSWRSWLSAVENFRRSDIEGDEDKLNDCQM